MNHFACYAASIGAAAALLTACGSQPPIAGPGAMPQSRAITTRAEHGGSWMAPDSVAQNLLYVSDENAVLVYSYPKGKLEGKLKGFFIATGLCVDKNGDVYVADQGYGRVYEYAHGDTKRIKTLYTGDAVGCSVDPTTGNLAVTDLQGSGSNGNGNVAIFKKARGNPTYYSDSAFWEYYFCGYDYEGNLFIDGLSRPGTGNFVFAKFPKNRGTFTNITLNQYVGWPGGVQWDGKHVAIGDQTIANVYEFSVAGSQGMLVGTTQLGGTSNVKQAWIQGRTLIAPNAISGHPGNALFYKYPAGVQPSRRLLKNFLLPRALR